MAFCVLPTPEIMAMSRSGPPPDPPPPEKAQTLQSNFLSRLECAAANVEPSPPRDSPYASSSHPGSVQGFRSSIRSRGSAPHVERVEIDKDVLAMLGPSPMSSPSASPTGSPELSSVTPVIRSTLPAPTPVFITAVAPAPAQPPPAPTPVVVVQKPADDRPTVTDVKPAKKLLSIPPPRVRPPSDAQSLSVSKPTSTSSARRPASSTRKPLPSRPLPGRSSAPTCSPIDHASFPSMIKSKDKGPVKIEDLGLGAPRARSRSRTVSGSQPRPFSPPSSQEFPDDEETRKDLLYRPQVEENVLSKK